jgi:hypothetical protein
VSRTGRLRPLRPRSCRVFDVAARAEGRTASRSIAWWSTFARKRFPRVKAMRTAKYSYAATTGSASADAIRVVRDNGLPCEKATRIRIPMCARTSCAEGAIILLLFGPLRSAPKTGIARFARHVLSMANVRRRVIRRGKLLNSPIRRKPGDATVTRKKGRRFARRTRPENV